jgi:AcrR family transcriptional regulator
MSEPATDGRVLRGERNRQAVVQAYLSMVQEGVLQPTAHAVAARAGVSPRSVFHHFADMESLLAAAAEAHVVEYLPLIHDLPRTGSFDLRLTAFVDQRSRIAEKVLPVFRAARLVEHASAIATERLNWTSDILRLETAEVFAPELGPTPDGTLDALDAITSLEAWVRFRDRQGLDAERTRDVVRLAITKLLQ